MTKIAQIKEVSVADFVEQTFPVQCHGRNSIGDKVLETPVSIDVVIHKSPGSNTISSVVKCTYNTGGHGQRCKASHPEEDKQGNGVLCPYSFDIPYAFEQKNH